MTLSLPLPPPRPLTRTQRETRRSDSGASRTHLRRLNGRKNKKKENLTLAKLPFFLYIFKGGKEKYPTHATLPIPPPTPDNKLDLFIHHSSPIRSAARREEQGIPTGRPISPLYLCTAHVLDVREIYILLSFSWLSLRDALLGGGRSSRVTETFLHCTGRIFFFLSFLLGHLLPYIPASLV